MTKSELIAAVAQETGVSAAKTGDVVNAVLSKISEALAADEKVQLLGFGTFETRTRAARESKNLRTGEKMMIAAAKVPAFKASKTLKDAVK